LAINRARSQLTFIGLFVWCRSPIQRRRK